jgi:hypothetical protein
VSYALLGPVSILVGGLADIDAVGLGRVMSMDGRYKENAGAIFFVLR